MITTERDRALATLRAKMRPQVRLYADLVARGMARREAALLAGFKAPPADSRQLAEYWALVIGPAPEPPSERLVEPEEIIRVVKGIMEDKEERTQDQLAAAKLLMQHAGMLTPDKGDGRDGDQVHFHLHLAAGSEAEAQRALEQAKVPEIQINPL